MKPLFDQATNLPRILLHVVIPGQPHTWERVGWMRGRSYNPNSEAKSRFLWELKAAAPSLKPDFVARLGVRLEVWSGKSDAWDEDIDNFAKFYLDAMSPPKAKKHKRTYVVKGVVQAPPFAVWGNDRQIDKLDVEVHRGSREPKIEILVYEVAQNGSL